MEVVSLIIACNTLNPKKKKKRVVSVTLGETTSLVLLDEWNVKASILQDLRKIWSQFCFMGKEVGCKTQEVEIHNCLKLLSKSEEVKRN